MRAYNELAAWWFSRQQWLDAFRTAGLEASSDLDEFGRDVLIARRR